MFQEVPGSLETRKDQVDNNARAEEIELETQTVSLCNLQIAANSFAAVLSIKPVPRQPNDLPFIFTVNI